MTEIVAIDVDDDGIDEVAVGDEGGGVTLFTGKGARQGLNSWPTAIARLDAGRLTGSDQLVVADLTGVHLLDLGKTTAPFFYTPLLAGLAISLVIAFAAWFIATIPPKPVLRVAARRSVGGRLAEPQPHAAREPGRCRTAARHRRDPAPAYLARLRELRGELADTQAALLKAGQHIQLETFSAPTAAARCPRPG